MRNYRDEGARWIQGVLDLLAAEEGDETERALDKEFILLRYFLLSEQYDTEELASERHLRVARDILAAFSSPGPEAARFPGFLWPFTAYFLEDSRAVLKLLNSAVANCRTHGGAWELAVVLLFRAHAHVDVPGGLAAADIDIPEIEGLAQSTGDRWLLSQICGLRAEIATQHGRYDEARGAR